MFFLDHDDCISKKFRTEVFFFVPDCDDEGGTLFNFIEHDIKGESLVPNRVDSLEDRMGLEFSTKTVDFAVGVGDTIVISRGNSLSLEKIDKDSPLDLRDMSFVRFIPAILTEIRSIVDSRGIKTEFNNTSQIITSSTY